MTVQLNAQIDTSVLRAAIPQIVAFGRRTLREQCVTSAAFICVNAQANTAAVSVGTIDADLDVEVTGITKTGRPSSAKKPYGHRVTTVKGGTTVPQAVLIVMARTNPNSGYSISTGNRWPLELSALPKGKGSMAARMAMISKWISTMTLRRHSSTHFLQHGWGPAVNQLLTDPAYYAGRSKVQIGAQLKINPLNTLKGEGLGLATVSQAGDAVMVSAENDVGEGGNPVLDEKHREALLLHGATPLQQAIDKEATVMIARIQKNLDDGLKQEFANL